MDDGQEHIRPLITDTHWLDIPEALSVLATPSARERPEVTRAVSEYVHLKLAMWRQMDPAIILLLGGTPAPMPGAGGGVPTLGSGEAGPGAAPQPEEQPRLPEPPKNPITGERDLATNATPNLPQS
jgi:hypothetical protein